MARKPALALALRVPADVEPPASVTTDVAGNATSVGRTVRVRRPR